MSNSETPFLPYPTLPSPSLSLSLVNIMRVAWTLCAPSASPAFTKVAHRCLLAPTTTRDARELDAAKPVALFGDGATKRKSPQSARVFGIRVRVTA